MANLSNINNILRISSSGVGLNKDNTGPSKLDIESAGADIIDMTRTGQKTYRFAISGASAFSLFDVAANADRLVINSAGNATFAGNVTVGNSGNINIPTAASGNANLHFDGTDFKITSNSSSANLKLETSSTTRLTINSAGIIGIGPSTTSSEIYFNYNNTNNKGGLKIDYSTGQLRLTAGESGNGYHQAFYTNGSERMRIESTGVVKFPNTATSTGDVGTIAHYTNNYMYMRGGTSGLAIGDDGFGVSIYLNNSNNIAFHTNAGTEVMQIDSVGNVGIGVVPEGNIVSYIKQLRIGEQTTIQGHADGVGGASASWFSTNYIFSVGGATTINTGESMVYQAQSGRHSFHNSESTAAGAVPVLRDGFSIEPNLDLKASTKGPQTQGVGVVYAAPYPLRFNTFNGTGPKFLGVYPLRGGSQFLDIAINTTSNGIMYYAMFRGYFYGRGSRWSWTGGYTYQGTIINIQNHFVLNGNTADLTAYRGAAGSAYPANLCFRMDSGSSGYTEGFGELYIFAHATTLQDAFQVTAFAENNAANPGLWT